MGKIIEKPWGKEELITLDKNYVLKKITMNKKCQCSLQYHEKKNETIYVLKGKLKIIFGKDLNSLEEVFLGPNESMEIKSPIVHRMFGEEHSVYLEASTPELNDVIRIQDDYGR
jgi:mannose-6-phosphate isomerase